MSEHEDDNSVNTEGMSEVPVVPSNEEVRRVVPSNEEVRKEKLYSKPPEDYQTYRSSMKKTRSGRNTL